MTAETSNARGEWDGTPTWRKQKPTRAGVYGVRGFNFGVPASEQFEAIVAVRLYNDELICNLHISTSEDDFDDWALVQDCNDNFEWCEFAAAPPPAAARGDVRGLVAKLAAHVRPTCSELWDEAQAFLAAEGVQAGEVETRLAEDRALLEAIRDVMGGGAYDTLPKRIASALLSQQPEARGAVDGWKPASVEPPHNPKNGSPGTEYLIYPPTNSGDRTALYGRRLGGAACWYRHGAQVHGVDYWQELPADPAALTGERNG